jgi:lipopolysaccharide/colanic/teichoic acid biosynthesis glycosyltransferase
MAIRWFTRWFSWLPDPSGGAALRSLCCVKKFRKTLARARARAERLDDGFCLLTLGVNDWRSGRPTLLHLARVVRRRLRITDEAGWLDERRIGVILPGTPVWGAWTVADDLCRSLPADVALPECEVYSYPADWIGSDEDRAAQPAIRRGTVVRRQPAAPIDAFFIQPLPLWKRAMDALLASAALVLFAPLIAVVAAAIKISSPGPALFRQQRLGLGGRPFTMYKFRSMVVDAERQQAKLMAMNEQQGPVFKIRNDPRITPLGRLLRKTSIDELPQLWNVLKGEMSFVGPRPPLAKEVRQYELWQRRRLDVTPGLTCTWQVSGRCRIAFTDWIRMDIRYICARSPGKDVGLLLRTLPAVILRTGAS